MRLTPDDLAAALPDVESTLRVPGLREPVEIVRDGWGIPHIRAGSARDAFFAQGFATAQDRLWHMDYDRQRALGRWAEWVGESGLQEDRLLRACDLERAAKADFAVSSAAAQEMLLAYAEGVNACIGALRALPVEYRLLDAAPEPWQAWHGLAVYKVRNMFMGTFQMKLWRARVALALGARRAAGLFRSYPDDGLVSVPPGGVFGVAEGDEYADGFAALEAAVAELGWLGEADGGSNAWVVSGARSASGLPLVAGDSHRALDTPNVYYQTHLACPAFRCSGFALPGVPGLPHFSHNEHVAWGMTHGFGDYQDLCIERFRTRRGRLEYAADGRWLPARSAERELRVRGGDAERMVAVRTRNGPIIAGDPGAGHGIALRHTGTERGTPWANALCELLAARSADAAEEALREWTEPVNNFVYADVQGAFGYRYRGRIPVRVAANAWAPVPGWSDAHAWRGRIPFAQMPQARDPQAGFVVTCNNAPVDASYPHYINTFFAADWRARRVTERIRELPAGSARVADMAAIHGDRVSLPARIFCVRATTLRSADADVRAAQRILRGWDGAMDRASAAAALYATARCHLYMRIAESALGSLAEQALAAPGRSSAAGHAGMLHAAAVAAMADGGDDASGVERGATWTQLIEWALGCAVAELRERLGDDPQAWTWGALHGTRPRHPLSRAFPENAQLLDPPAIATHGDGDTPLAGSYAVADRFAATSLSVNRYIHDVGDWRNSRWIVPLGASGHPGSPHYADQAALWADVRTTAQLWEWPDILAAAESRQTLLP